MKRLLILLAVLSLIIPGVSWADKISELTALTTVATGDLFAVVDVSEPAAADQNKKITWGSLVGAPGAIGGTTPGLATFDNVTIGAVDPGGPGFNLSEVRIFIPWKSPCKSRPPDKLGAYIRQHPYIIVEDGSRRIRTAAAKPGVRHRARKVILQDLARYLTVEPVVPPPGRGDAENAREKENRNQSRPQNTLHHEFPLFPARANSCFVTKPKTVTSARTNARTHANQNRLRFREISSLSLLW